MCGIVGIFSNQNSLHQKIDEAINNIHHRGPDFQTSKKINKNLSFGHARLAIVDLNERSHQPFYDAKTGNYIIFNGEIYNYKELKKLLPHREFHTNSDTEILLYLLSDLNPKEVLNQCNGMFAFALWKEKEQMLVLGRDRFGKKPLFFTHNSEGLKFASESKALRPLGVNFEVNHEAVINYIFEITIGKNEQSFFKDIYQLKNGCLAIYTINHEGNIIHEKTERYWNYPKQTRKISYLDAVDEFRSLIKKAVNTRLAEEVDFAIMISGGLDSSTIASFAAEFNPDKKITSISAIYPGDEKDESYYAKMVTEKYKNLNPVWIDDIDHKKFNETIKSVIYHLECPIADGSLIAQHVLMKKISEMGIKVILSGNGGDEVLAGYLTIFNPPKEIEDLKAGKLSIPSVRTFYHMLPNNIKNYIYRNKHKKLGILTYNHILGKIWKRFTDYGTNDLLNNYLINGLEHWTLPNLMWYEDRNSMAASIESRCPFLDFQLVEFLLQLPASFKIEKGFSKQILRDAAKGIVPQPILDRTDKQGFHAPTDKWVEHIDKNFLKDLDFKTEFDYLNLSKIEKAPFRMFWRTYTLYLWYKEFIKKE
ncbi:MAG: asparagine synthase (glutamine-hydrolyzing) [Flavobacteriales bacterium CG18_big_fil_WC_8_21_14_2_50_32_9]|nr:MAG: asparagine synthase (glutamine-hydrolyzing) [Flavobacteriales bacterium CG18_big_fil_WC_8_21_14_2_50_32_9]